MSKGKHYRLAILIGVWILSAAYVFPFIDRGWIPHDDGALAHSAERVLNGELPHKDFDEIYTGGLSFLYAAAFKVLGVNLLSIRIIVYIFFLVFVPALYSIALRFGSPLVAGVVTLLAVVWSVPNYFTGLPSWYNLFFAVFGTAAFIRHLEKPDAKWVIFAGICGGLSFLAKQSGVFYIMAGLLFLTYREQLLSTGGKREQELTFSKFLLLKVSLYLALIFMLVTLIESRRTLLNFIHFVLPTVLICVNLAWLESTEGSGSFTARLRTMVGLLTPFLAGAMIPIALFLVPYVVSDSIADLYRGVVILPQTRLDYASMSFPPIVTLLAGLPYGALLVCGISPHRLRIVDKIFAVALITAMILGLGFASNVYVYQVIWQSARSLSVIAVLAACIILARFLPISSIKRDCLMLLVIVTALVSLVQFPFSAPIYFCYTAPVLAVTILAITTVQDNAPRIVHLVVLAFYFAFAVLWLNTAYVVDHYGNLILGARHSNYRADSVLALDRSGIRILNAEKELYTRLVHLAREHSGSGYIYAAPDSPEIYFLAGLRNPTRDIFDFLGDTPSRKFDIITSLENKKVEFVVINRAPRHSSALDPYLVKELQVRFPHTLDLEHFTIRWRD